MIETLLALMMGGLPVDYANLPTDGISTCEAVDQRYGRILDRRRDDYEKNRIYFDLDRWPCEDLGLFFVGWYSGALETLDEPSFEFKRSAKGYRDRLRILAFSHTGPGYILRMDYRNDGRVELTFAENDWLVSRNAKGERIGRPERILKRRWSKVIDRTKAEQLREDIILSGLLKGRFLPRLSKAKTEPDVGSDESICISMSSAVLERLDDKGTHTLAETGCDQSEMIYDLIDSFHALAGYQPLTLAPYGADEGNRETTDN